MRELFQMAEFLVASWRLANGNERMATSHGVLDEALHETIDALPDQLKDALTFGNTRVGFRCYELPDVLYCAQANLLTSEPNPTYLTTAVQIDEGAARRLIKRQSLDVGRAREFGMKLQDAIEVAKIRAAASETVAAA